VSVTALNSGMAAISNTMITIAQTGSNIVTSRHLFGNTYSFFASTLAAFGVEIRFCDLTNPDEVEAEIETRELARIIEVFLNTLTVENRVIFMRRYWFSDSCKDIAEFVGLSEKNISVRLTRIRQKMKSYLAEREVFV
jgi:RNA polymerase sigma factor (sigma-70 family)